jgi:putative ABC transport system permease protein
MDPDLPVVDLLMMEEVVSQSVWQNRLYAILFSVFAGIAMLLAAVGIYGVMSYSVTQRTQEIGIRMALGAQVKDVLRLVVRGGLALSMIGVAIGLAGAFALTRLLRSLLFGVTPTDAVTFVGVSLMLLFVALLACYIPARRASKVDPLVALRYE